MFFLFSFFSMLYFLFLCGIVNFSVFAIVSISYFVLALMSHYLHSCHGFSFAANVYPFFSFSASYMFFQSIVAFRPSNFPSFQLSYSLYCFPKFCFCFLSCFVVVYQYFSFCFQSCFVVVFQYFCFFMSCFFAVCQKYCFSIFS